MIKTIKIRHFGIVVKDMARSLHFYQDILGLKIFSDNIETGNFIDKILGLPKAKVRTVKMGIAKETTLVELLEFRSHKMKNAAKKKIYDLGPRHIAFEVENIHKAYISMKKKRIKFISSPCISPNGKAKVAFCIGPEKQIIELVEVL